MWLIRFPVFHVDQYCFIAFNLTIIAQSRLLYSQIKINCFYYKFNFMLQILTNIFWPIKIKIKTRDFRISYYNHVFFNYYNDLIKLLQTFLVISLRC